MKKVKNAIKFLIVFLMSINIFGVNIKAVNTKIDVDDMQKLVYSDGESSMPYRLYIPEDYDSTKEYPTIVFLHGAGERGNNNTSQLANAIQNLFDTQEQMKNAIVIAPQCPSGKRWVETDWTKGNYDSDAIAEEQLAIVMKILESVQMQYSTDNDRIYAIGLSMGGFGTWNLLMNHSDVFAAGIPICGGADTSKAEILKDIPIWTFHGTSDPTVPYSGTKEMVDAIQAVGGQKITFTTYEGANHIIWNTAAETEGLIDWLFSQKLSDCQLYNLYDKNHYDNWDNALTNNGNKLVNETNYQNIFTTHPIEVKNGDTLYWGSFGQETYVMEVYNKDHQFIKQVLFKEAESTDLGTTVTGVGNKTVNEYRYSYKITNEDAAYVRILGNISTKDRFQVFKNLEENNLEYPDTYIPYEDNVLIGKSVLFAGDSITNAIKDDYQLSGWAGRIGESNNMNWINAGVSGASASTSRGSNRVINQLKNHSNKDYDYIILHAGVNDAMDSVEVGSMSDSYNINDFDTSTFAGGLEELFYYTTKNYYGKKIGYIINYATPNSTWGGNTKDMSAYFETAKEICDKWEIPYIDLYSGTIELDGKEYSYSHDILNVESSGSFYNNDSGEVHIGGKGYDIISPYIGYWMRSIESNTIGSELGDIQENIALNATISADKEAKDRSSIAGINDGIMQDVRSNFTIFYNSDLPTIELKWEKPQTITDIHLFTFCAKRFGPTKYELFYILEGQEEPHSLGIKTIEWQTDLNTIFEANEWKFEEPLENVVSLQFKMMQGGSAGKCTIQEIEVYGYERKEIPYVVSCESFAELNVNHIDEVSENLPKSGNVLLSNDEKLFVPIIWNLENLNDETNDFILEGTLELPEGYSNKDNIKAKIEVSINVDKSQLIDLINRIESKLNKIDENLYTETSLTALKKSLEDAKKVVEDDSLSQKYVDFAYDSLIKANKLEYKSADYEELNKVIAEVENILNSKNYEKFYTESSRNDLELKYAAAKKIETDLDITKQEEIDTVKDALENAKANLIFNSADYSKVNDAVTKANGLNKDLYKDFSAVEKALKAVIPDLDITHQAEVDTMAKAIEDAINALEYKGADYSAVEKAKAKVPTDLSIYTEESVKALNDALAGVVEGKNITEQEEVDTMAKAIENAINGLVKKDTGKPEDPSKPADPAIPVEPENPTTPSEPETPTEPEEPNTSDNYQVTVFTGLMILSACVLAFVLLKRKREAK